MKTIKFLYLFFALVGCLQKEILITDQDITYGGEYIYYKKEKLSGVLVTKFEANGVIRKTPFREGKIEGAQKEYFANDLLASERFYENGIRVGTHRGWYPNGNMRFQYDYENGQMHGSLWEWKEDGSLSSYAKMVRGQEVGRKVWREDGQIYANYVFRNGQIVGLPGGKLCRQVKGDENGNTKAF